MAHSSPELIVKDRNLDLVRTLNEHGVEFLVIGGLAVRYYGCRDWHQVDDLDLLINPTEENARRFERSLASLDISFSGSCEKLLQPKTQVPIKNYEYWTDVLTPDEGVRFPDLQRRAQTATIKSVPIPIISRLDLIAMKRRALEADLEGVEKHRKDLECLGDT